MSVHDPSYYEDIEITVDGWTWNVDETDFRRAESPSPGSPIVETRRIAHEKRVAALMAAVSGNRRADRRAGERRASERRSGERRASERSRR
jgi:hypothetical protein